MTKEDIVCRDCVYSKKIEKLKGSPYEYSVLCCNKMMSYYRGSKEKNYVSLAISPHNTCSIRSKKSLWGIEERWDKITL